jgi:hypothetical protein
LIADASPGLKVIENYSVTNVESSQVPIRQTNLPVTSENYGWHLTATKLERF